MANEKDFFTFDEAGRATYHDNNDQVALVQQNPVEEKKLWREMYAEFLGTMIFVLIGDGVVCQTVISQGLENKAALAHEKNVDLTHFAGDWATISFGYGIGLMLGLYVAAGVSGGHLNPAVSIAMWKQGKLPWKKVLYYSGAQFAGAFVGAMIVYIFYYNGLVHLDIWNISTAGIFATYPKDHLGIFAGFIDEVIGSAILLLGICAITDKYNNQAEDGMKPVVIGMLLTGIALSFGYNTGFALNPARDFAPRVFTAMAGWGMQVFTAGHCWFWVPCFAPVVGAVLGAQLYDILIVKNHPQAPGYSSDVADMS